ncbi:hypothetical protein WJX84_008493 [Apatococcus fuscideae]|uniref:RHOMBOID-like protein n=1 Tax=Apatococcus fuscideae TaxID=2026836 RepID=A0AAW1TA35_9CHLO
MTSRFYHRRQQEFASQLPQLGVILDYDSSSTSPEDARAIQQLRNSGHVVTISSRSRGQHLVSPAGYQPPHLVPHSPWPDAEGGGRSYLPSSSSYHDVTSSYQRESPGTSLSAWPELSLDRSSSEPDESSTRTPRYGDWVGHEIRQAVQQETMPYPAEHLSPVPSESKGKQAAHVRGHSKASSIAGSISSGAAPPLQQLPARLHSDKAGANVKKTDAPTEDVKTNPAAVPATPAARASQPQEELPDLCLWSYRCLGGLIHYLGLVFQEHPMRTHREWAGIVERPDRADDLETGNRRRGTKRAFFRRFHANNRLCRFMPLETMADHYAQRPKRRRLAYALRRKRTGYNHFWEQAYNELFIFGQLMFDWATPTKLKNQMPFFTALFIMVCTITFAFMAGEWPAYLVGNPDATHTCVATETAYGPHALAKWVAHWRGCYKFDSGFLILWGASYGPRLYGTQWYRWFTSLLIYDSFVHLATNLFIFGVLSLHLEWRYGTCRTLLLAFISGVGGNLFSAAFQNLCHVVISGSGISAGMLGLFIGDLLFNFEAVRYPFFRIFLAITAATLFILASAIYGHPYRLTTAGGFAVGLFPGIVMLPHFKSEKYEWFQPFLAAFILVGFFVALPLYLYLKRLPVVC